MRALFYKQLRLVCHPMTLLFTLFGVMLLIPSYPYTVAYFYVTLGIFFMMMNGREQRDADFTAILPVRKRDAARVTVLFSAAVELMSLVLSLPFAAISVRINPNGGNAVGLDPNAALFGVALLMYAVFNAVFFLSFYRTGYKVGISFLKGILAMLPVMLIGEALPHFPGLVWLNDTTAAGNLRQLPILLAGAVIFAAGLWLTCRCAAARYEKVDL